jgi:PAS domain S-box-containing protein
VKRRILETEKLDNKKNKAKEKTLESGKRYHAIFDNMLNGFALCKLLTDKRGYPIDYIFLEVNSAFEKINSIKREEVINKKVSEVFGFKVIPDLKKYAQIALQGEKKVFETYIPRYNRYFKVSSYSPKKGCFVTIFEDITKLKRSKEREKKHIFEMDYLYKTALDFVEYGPKDDIYQFICKKLKKIVGGSIILVNSYDKASDSFYVRSLEGIGGKIKYVLQIIGKDLFTRPFSVNNEEARSQLISGELLKVPGGLYKLSFGQIPKSICYTLEKFFNVGEIYTSGFAKGKELFGDTIIILPKGTELNNREFINTFIKQSAIMLQSKQAEEELKNSEERLKILFDYAPDACYISDLEGKFIDGNIAAERVIGYKKEELIGKSFLKLKLLSLTDIPKAAKLLVKNIIGQPTGPDEFVLNRKDNSKVTVGISTYPVKIKGKTLVLGIARDITKRKKAEEKIQELNKKLNSLLEHRTKELIKEQNYTNYLLENSPDFQITLDTKGKIIGANRVCEEIIRKDKEELIGRSISKYLPQEETKKIIDKVLKEKQVRNVEVTINMSEKNPLIFDFSGATFIDLQGETGVYLSGRDITKRRKLQQNLKELSENLEKKVIERTKKLRETQEQLIQAEKLSVIGQLAAGIAHEIRNPLTTMSLAIQHLEKKCYEDFQKNKLELVQKNIDRINKIIQELLTFSRPYSFNFTCENVNAIIERLEPMLKNLHPGEIKNIKIIKKYNPKLPKAWVDSHHLEQVFLNLALNAIDATKYKRELYISTNYDPKQEKIEIKFKDTGYGIAEENLKKIFHPFFTTHEDGTGLGLPICQMIINEHKGNISAESRLGEGTTFTILLPLNRRRGR